MPMKHAADTTTQDNRTGRDRLGSGQDETEQGEAESPRLELGLARTDEDITHSCGSNAMLKVGAGVHVLVLWYWVGF